jgi:DNA-directed RNA polymerase subunit RPC12/RpoP
MASKRRRKVPVRLDDRPKKDRLSTAHKMQLEQRQVQEAEMEARTLGQTRRVAVVCANCKQRSEFEINNGVPIAECPNCGQRVALRQPGNPQVVSR